MPPRCQPRLLLPPLTCTKSGVQMVTPGYWEIENSWACPKTSTSKSSVSTTQKCAKQEVLDTPIQTCFIISIERISLYSSLSKKLNPKSKRHLQRHPRFRMACAHHCFWKAGCNTSTATVGWGPWLSYIMQVSLREMMIHKIWLDRKFGNSKLNNMTCTQHVCICILDVYQNAYASSFDIQVDPDTLPQALQQAPHQRVPKPLREATSTGLIPFYWEVWSERQMFFLGFTWNLQFLTLHRALQQGKYPREEEPWDAGALATVTSSLGTTTTTSKKYPQTNITTRMNSGSFNSDWMKSENGMESSLWDDKRPSCSLQFQKVLCLKGCWILRKGYSCKARTFQIHGCGWLINCQALTNHWNHVGSIYNRSV